MGSISQDRSISSSETSLDPDILKDLLKDKEDFSQVSSNELLDEDLSQAVSSNELYKEDFSQVSLDPLILKELLDEEKVEVNNRSLKRYFNKAFGDQNTMGQTKMKKEMD